MTTDEAVALAKKAGHPQAGMDGLFHHRFANLLAAAERERICKAIKDEDDYCVTEGDYMLDSDDCIAVAKGDWVRPEFAVSASHVRSQS